MDTRARAMLVLALASGLTLARAARADAPSTNKADSEALFYEGRALVAQGKLAEGCAKFETSQRLYPAVGTLFNLADCALKQGRTASAWVHLREAASLAARSSDAERQAAANARARALEPKLARLTLRAPASDASWSIQRDGASVGAAALGAAIPVDPGAHAIAVSAPHKKSWTTSIDVAEGASVTVAIPALEDDAANAAPAPGASAPAPPPRADAAETHRAIRPGTWIAGGAAVVLAAGGAVAGVMAATTWSRVTSSCPDARCADASTTSWATSEKHQASTDALVSDVAFAGAGVAAAIAAVLYLTTPATPRAALRVAPAVAPAFAGLRVDGAF